MMKRVIATAAMVVFFSAPTLAGHCPKDVKAIDAALSKTSLSASQMSQVKKLRDSGDTLHKTKKHGDSLAELHRAMEILGLRH